LWSPATTTKSYIHWQYKDYLDGKLTAITHKALSTSAKRKLDWLKAKGIWGAISPDGEKIVAMTATLNALKGKLVFILCGTLLYQTVPQKILGVSYHTVWYS
jgi:hypothetical protein